MNVTMMLADSAQAVGGKLYILGGGWSIATSPSGPIAIVLKIEVPWTEANVRHRVRVVLHDEDGRTVRIPNIRRLAMM